MFSTAKERTKRKFGLDLKMSAVRLALSLTLPDRVASPSKTVHPHSANLNRTKQKMGFLDGWI